MSIRSRFSRFWRYAVVTATLSIAACAPSEERVLERAKAYRDAGDNAAASLELKNLLTTQPKNPEAYLRAGIVMAELGELVMNRLKKLDKVAYVRFASVYMDFKDVQEFMGELKNLLKDKTKK